jgi:dipeptidyl aminopeptidase/acylaminoacyl peptidase
MSLHDVKQYQAYRLYSNVTFSPDGQWIVYATTRVQNGANATILQQAVLPGPDGRPSMPLELTLERPATHWGAVWSPDGTRILTTAFRSGTTSIHLHEVPPHLGWLYPLPGDDSPRTRHNIGNRPFSPDGRRIVYREFSPMEEADRPRESTTIVIRDVQSGNTMTCVPDGAAYIPHSWSPDGSSILLWQLVARDEHRLWLCDPVSGEIQPLSPGAALSRFEPVGWSPDGRGVWLRTDHGRDFLGLAYLDVRDRSLTWVETPEWDIECAAVSGDGRHLAWVTNEDGYSRLSV